MVSSGGPWRWLRWVIAAVVVVAVLAVAGPFVFFHFIEGNGPAQPSLFTLTRPIALAPLPAAGTIKTYSATGHLTLHGQTRSVTFPLKAERTANAIEAQGSIPVLFSWGSPNPSCTGFVTTQNHGIMEFLLDFRHA